MGLAFAIVDLVREKITLVACVCVFLGIFSQAYHIPCRDFAIQRNPPIACLLCNNKLNRTLSTAYTSHRKKFLSQFEDELRAPLHQRGPYKWNGEREEVLKVGIFTKGECYNFHEHPKDEQHAHPCCDFVKAFQSTRVKERLLELEQRFQAHFSLSIYNLPSVMSEQNETPAGHALYVEKLSPSVVHIPPPFPF